MDRKVYLYRRFSSDEQEKGDSLSRQQRNCETFAMSQQWTISERLLDRGRSAYKGDHLSPDAELGKFVQMVERGEHPENTVLLAERLDRLSRRPVGEAMAWLHYLTSRGVSVAIADKNKIFTAKMGFEDFITAALPFAQSNEESAKKSERITSAKEALWGLAEKKEGKWTNLAARPPLWLSRNEAKNGWVVDRHREAIIRDIYQWSADGLGAVLITRRLNSTGEKPWGKWHRYADGKWGRTAVRQLLTNPAVEGDFVPETGMFVGRVLHGFYPRIVDADVVVKARAQQSARKRRPGTWAGEVGREPTKPTERKKPTRRSRGFSSLFAGVTYCVCGKRAFLTSSVSKGRYYPYIRCEGASDGRCDYKNTGYYAYEAFEETALDLCLDLALDDRFFEATGDLREAQRRKAQLIKSIDDVRSQRDRLLERLISKDAEDEQANALDTRLKARLAGLRQELATAEDDLAKASGKVSAVEHIRRVTDIREAASSDDPHVREQARGKLRQAFTAILNSVEIDRSPEGVKVFRVALLGGILILEINTKGELIEDISDVGGVALYESLTADQRAVAEPLIRRLKEWRAARGLPTNLPLHREPLSGDGCYTFPSDAKTSYG